MKKLLLLALLLAPSSAWAQCTGVFTAGTVCGAVTAGPPSAVLLGGFGSPTVVTTVGALPTCNAGLRGARYFVTDQGAIVGYHSAISGGGATGQAVTCDGTAWYQD